MNADTWLRLATDGLPEVVKTRVAHETQEHLADAGLGSVADVEPVLGAPEDTAKELKRLYLTEGEITMFKDDRFFFFLMTITGFLAVTFLLSAYYSSSALQHHLNALNLDPNGVFLRQEYLYRIFFESVIFSLNAFLFLKSLTLAKIERTQHISLTFAISLLNVLPIFLDADRSSSFYDLTLALVYLIVSLSSFQYWRQQRQKLRRTLRLM